MPVIKAEERSCSMFIQPAGSMEHKTLTGSDTPHNSTMLITDLFFIEKWPLSFMK